ncbi:cytidine deaminase [Thermoflexus sp.]|uniref:cytidine deaminase n=1 Tax=Thermoflexus sp. TaxID=1969742 RepID=UPI0026247E13|nr:cytidine deaminase [Thermoflexus sp.]MCX7691294.1 cytidine deaminase [Thermoflexus sp.]
MEDRVLVELAFLMRERAYAPYSGYRVGAALLSVSGQVFTGCNVENAVYPLGLCAERVAVFKAISEGEHRFTTIAIATENGGTPCGACRQVLSEFAPDLRILLVDARGTVRETSLRALLPEPFGPGDLKAVYRQPGT